MFLVTEHHWTLTERIRATEGSDGAGVWQECTSSSIGPKQHQTTEPTKQTIFTSWASVSEIGPWAPDHRSEPPLPPSWKQRYWNFFSFIIESSTNPFISSHFLPPTSPVSHKPLAPTCLWQALFPFGGSLVYSTDTNRLPCMSLTLPFSAPIL